MNINVPRPDKPGTTPNNKRTPRQLAEDWITYESDPAKYHWSTQEKGLAVARGQVCALLDIADAIRSATPGGGPVDWRVPAIVWLDRVGAEQAASEHRGDATACRELAQQLRDSIEEGEWP